MTDLVARYWWVPLFTVPALALVLKLLAERSGAVDALRPAVRAKLLAATPVSPDGWRVTATLADGRRFSGVVVTERFRLGQPQTPFRLHDIVDVAWEGRAEPGAPGAPVQLSEAGRT